MRVKDDVRATSVVQRLKVGEKFSDVDGDWEVVEPGTKTLGDKVHVYVKPYPNGNHRTRTYVYDHGFQVTMIRT